MYICICTVGKSDIIHVVSSQDRPSERISKINSAQQDSLLRLLLCFVFV